jgi:diguanylate cyclase (GGDEF)-like protein
MRYLLIFLSIIASHFAAAAGPAAVSVPTVVAVVVALACVALAVKFWLDRQGLVDARADLEQRFVQSERTVHQLQVERGELERSVAQKKIAIAQIDQQHRQTHEMLVALRQQVERVARIDGHTGVANEQHFNETLNEEIKRSVRQRKPLTLLVGELDFFEDYIDIHGRERGDFVLQTVAGNVSDMFRRAGDLVARVGTARFAVILPETDLRTGERFGEKLRRGIYDLCMPFPGSDAADRLTISVGAVTVPPKRLHDCNEVTAMAQDALAHAQSSGYNQVSMAANIAA